MSRESLVKGFALFVTWAVAIIVAEVIAEAIYPLARMVEEN